ncbi:TlyA family rRNA (cytidine-2'-O)-methyltransferase [Alteribacter lacisalsi]|jgi:23S rRNA (cytidine1920-2'-O)/16S rRNA (cytidine1409-2'-O)-methyltransferase|uniref:TlyA family rRNA (Cytidine-2'-O)-methyltransferase n=1 Tax=Alteribacter lacisalsi TaxID=2045244 RepID=A0A2W0HEY9_9BACI|nr:TlyA family RNA methyltransferase [Alteribacter lacisalsi]PYZ98570.1 TlyA family rRNA (cytidine-2'-O)-methyltransferase [Alteribacter lacisalsi]
MEKKQRLDLLLVERGLIETREKAKRTIMAGLVFADGERVDKPGTRLKESVSLELKGRTLPYVSRGGLKLEGALKEFGFSLEGRTMLDIGSSTGGFTDCALQNGAAQVYAVDVGYNQLAWKLRQDERVIVMERTNFRYSVPEDFTQGLPDFSTIDVSFISLRLILPPLLRILKEGGEVSALVKPQFEAGREEVGKNGIIRDPAVHQRVLEETAAFAQELGFIVKDAAPSPIRGGEGNIEFLLYLKKPLKNEERPSIKKDFARIVAKAHELKSRQV